MKVYLDSSRVAVGDRVTIRRVEHFARGRGHDGDVDYTYATTRLTSRETFVPGGHADIFDHDAIVTRVAADGKSVTTRRA